MVSTSQLEYILAVDKEKHFGRAAELCNVTQPSLSMQIQKLEEELETIIFDRSKKPILTTTSGEEIITQARSILNEHKKLKQIAKNTNKEVKGDFKLAVIPTLAPYLIPLFLGDFAKQYPQVNLKINEYKTEDIIRKLISDELDAALLVTPLNDTRLIERHLFFEPFYAFISEEHDLFKKKKLNEKDLDTNNLWLLEEGHCFRDQVLSICKLKNRKSTFGNVEFTSGNLETLKNLVKTNAGFTLLPHLAVLNLSQKEKKHYTREFSNPIPTREVSIVYSRSFLKENIISAMEEKVLSNLPQNIRSLKKQDIEIVEF